MVPLKKSFERAGSKALAFLTPRKIVYNFGLWVRYNKMNETK